MSTHLRDGAAPEDDDARRQLTAAEVALDKELLKLMQMACKADKLEAALEAARLLTHPASLEAAIKLAGFFRLGGLEQRIIRLRERDGPAQPEKRESRWAPLTDERTISAPMANAAPSTRAVIDLLAMPFDAERRAKTAASRPPPAPKAVRPVAPALRNDDSGLGSSEAEPLAFDEDEDEEVEPATMDVDEPPAPRPPAQAIAAATARNLFAKKPKPPVAPSTAASAVSTATGRKGGPISSAALKKSDSFLVRVEAEQAQQEAAAKGPRQATLFGSKPPPAAEPAAKKTNRGKKRKSEEGSVKEAEGGPKEKISAPKQTLTSLFERQTSKSSLAVTSVEEDEDETQIIEETQLVESVRPSHLPRRRQRLTRCTQPQSMKRARLEQSEELPDASMVEA